MISRTSNNSFFSQYWDRLALLVAVVVFATGAMMLFSSAGADPDQDADDAVREHTSRIKRGKAVEKADLKHYEELVRRIENPKKLIQISTTGASFMASERRVFCAQGETGKPQSCNKPIPEGLKECPYCHAIQPVEKEVTLDTDGDGMSDVYEKKYGLNHNKNDANEDLDKDGFSNIEEMTAGTDPTDPKSHSDYLDSLKVELPVKKTTIPFVFEKVTKLPGGQYRFYFFDPVKRKYVGGFSGVKQGEEIKGTGYSAGSYTERIEKKAIAGGKDKKSGVTMNRSQDNSIATIIRKSDGKKIDLVVGVRNTPEDVQVVLFYDRGEGEKFTVVPGSIITISGVKYKIKSILGDENGAKVVLEHLLLGTERTITNP